MNYDRAGTSSSLQYFIWMKSKIVKIYSVVQYIKLLLVLSIYRISARFHLIYNVPICLLVLRRSVQIKDLSDIFFTLFSQENVGASI